MLFSTSTPIIVKDIQPNEVEFFMHCMAVPNELEEALSIPECRNMTLDENYR